MSAAREAERTQERKGRERHAVEARKAIQMARHWADKGNRLNAESWAERAVSEAESFRRDLLAEMIP